jgi:hypothetical protein
VYVQLLALGVIASVLVGFSAWKFRADELDVTNH